MKSYFGYIRVSTQKQGVQGSSLQEQKSAIEAHASRQGLGIVGWYEETETAAKQGRQMFNQMMVELEKGQAAGVIIHKIDRSARNLRDWARLGDLIDRGIEVHFAHESLDLNSRGGRLSADIQAVVASDYIRNLKQEVRKGFYGRLKQGLYPLPAPIGYLNNGKAKAKTHDPGRAPLVRQMFDLYAAGNHNLDQLRLEMHRRGLSGPSGKPLSKNGVARTLHNSFYIGVIRIERTGETFAGVHEPLVAKTVFDRVQGLLSGRSYAHVLKHGFVFRRLIKCAACGYSLIGERQKGHVYYRCHSATCRGTTLREDKISADLSCLMRHLSFSSEELASLRNLVGEATQIEQQGQAEARSQLVRTLGLCEDRLTRLTDAFIDGHLDKETYQERKSSLLHERSGLKEQLGKPPDDLPSIALLKNLELANTAHLGFNSPDRDEKRDALKYVTSNLVAQGKELAITPLFPFDEVLKVRFSQDGAPCWGGPRTSGPITHSGQCTELARSDAFPNTFWMKLIPLPEA